MGTALENRAIVDDLLRRGRELLNAAPEPVNFETGIPAAEEILNDIDSLPHIYVLGCVMDRQIKAGRAWAIPYLIGTEIGGFEFESFKSLSQDQYRDLFTRKRYHRFNTKAAEAFFFALKRIAEKYDGNASEIWNSNPSSALVVRRFLEFRGVGIKIATMAANILVRHFKVPMSDFSSIDISPDRRVTRFFVKHGLIQPHASREELIYLAREICPEFPGLLDYAAFLDGEFRRSK